MSKQKQHAIVAPSNSVHISTLPLILAKKNETKNQGKDKKEAISATSQVAQVRAKPKESCKIRESNTTPFKNHTFQTILIQEGMGNFQDCFFYTKEALQTAVQSKLFEGVQCFADHPTEVEEQIQPERSTRDILGYYENVTYEESEDGTGRLVANLCIGNSISLDWAMSLLTNSIDYSTKFKEADLVGLSINASGSANPVSIDDFIASQQLSDSIVAKLNEAKQQGITQINVVSELTQAQSVDLVTKAGAGGRILKMLEMEKTMSKKLNLNFSESESHEEGAPAPSAAPAPAGHAAPAQDGGATPDHTDEDQDKALFAKMIKQYLGKDDADPEEMEMAKNAYEAHKEAGMEHEAAYEAAGQHLKMAMAIGHKMAQKQAEKKHESESESESEVKHESESEAESKKEAQQVPTSSGKSGDAVEKKKESMIVKLSGEVAKLRESVKKYELRDYLEAKMSKSGKPVHVTKKFKEALGAPKSIEHIDNTWKIFIKAYEAGSEEVGSDDGALFVEKNAYRNESEKSDSFSDCLR